MQIKQRDAILYTYSGNNEDKAWWTNLNIAILINQLNAESEAKFMIWTMKQNMFISDSEEQCKLSDY